MIAASMASHVSVSESKKGLGGLMEMSNRAHEKQIEEEEAPILDMTNDQLRNSWAQRSNSKRNRTPQSS